MKCNLKYDHLCISSGGVLGSAFTATKNKKDETNCLPLTREERVEREVGMVCVS